VGVAGFSRATGRLHVLTPRHLERFAAVTRQRPDLAPLLDLRQFEAGGESIEELSRNSHRHMVTHGLDPQLFSVFCELNAERLLATLERHLDEEGLPLDEEAVLGELYARLHRWYFERSADSTSRPAALENALFDAMGRATSVIHGLAEVGRQIVTERVRMLRASAIAIVSAPVAAVAVADSLIVDAARYLSTRRLRLPADDLRRWITYALLGLPGVERRLIHLRCRRELTLQEIAERLGLAPFEAGVRLRNAVASLHDEVERLLHVHEGDEFAGEGHPELARPPGRLLELRQRQRESTPANGITEPATDTASSNDEGADHE
jgi:DNA-directed RNA polymerase specialized sigma24 family protein